MASTVSIPASGVFRGGSLRSAAALGILASGAVITAAWWILLGYGTYRLIAGMIS